MIFLTTARELHLPPDACFVIEDATSGVQAAKSSGMSAIGVARLGDHELLARAGADLVVTTLNLPNWLSLQLTWHDTDSRRTSAVARAWTAGWSTQGCNGAATWTAVT